MMQIETILANTKLLTIDCHTLIFYNNKAINQALLANYIKDYIVIQHNNININIPANATITKPIIIIYINDNKFKITPHDNSPNNINININITKANRYIFTSSKNLIVIAHEFLTVIIFQKLIS